MCDLLGSFQQWLLRSVDVFTVTCVLNTRMHNKDSAIDASPKIKRRDQRAVLRFTPVTLSLEVIVLRSARTDFLAIAMQHRYSTEAAVQPERCIGLGGIHTPPGL